MWSILLGVEEGQGSVFILIFKAFKNEKRSQRGTRAIFWDETEDETYWKVQDQDFLMIESGSWPWRDRESRAFNLNKFIIFPIICDKTMAETSWKINKKTSPKPRLTNNQNWSKTETRPRLLVPLVSKPRRDWESCSSLRSYENFKHSG